MRAIPALCALLAGAPLSYAQDSKPNSVTGNELRQKLSTLGFEPQSLSEDVCQVTITRDGWKVHTLVSLSPDGSRIWLECKFPPIPDPDCVPAAAWQRLLEENDRISPAHFAFKKEDGRIHLFQSIDNRHLTSARLRSEIENVDRTVRNTQSVWAAEPFRPLPGPEVLTAQPRELPPDTSAQLRQLQGVWHITVLEMRGQRATPQQIEDVKPTLIFDKDIAILQTGAVDKVTTIRLGKSDSVMEIDFVDVKKQVEKGIWKWDPLESTCRHASLSIL